MDKEWMMFAVAEIDVTGNESNKGQVQVIG